MLCTSNSTSQMKSRLQAENDADVHILRSILCLGACDNVKEDGGVILKRNACFRIYMFYGFLYYLFYAVFIIPLVYPVSAFCFDNQKKSFMSVGIGVDYSNGDFGTGYSTDFVSVPFVIDFYPTDRLDFEISTSFIYQSNSHNNYFGTGGGYQNKKGLMLYGSGTGITVGRSKQVNQETGDHAENGFSGSNRSGSRELSGFGDVYVSAAYTVVSEGDIMPETRLVSMIKIPTADSDNGLGSGEFDFGPGVTLGKWFGNWRFLVRGSYIFCGSSSDNYESGSYEPEDHFTCEAETGWQFTDSLYSALSLYGAGELSEGSEEPLEGRVRVSWSPLPDVRLEAYYSRGFSDGSPDNGAGLAVFHDF